MCLDPTMIVSLFQWTEVHTAKKEDDAIRQQQILQNQIAERDRITAEAREKFRIRKKSKLKKESFLVAQETDAKRAAAIASAETVGGKSVDDLIIDFTDKKVSMKLLS